MSKIPNDVAKSQLATLCARLNSGYMRVYSGTVPATADTALTVQVLLGTLRFAATAFGTPGDLNPGAYADANAMVEDDDADETGAQSFVRCFEDDNTTLVVQLTAGLIGDEGVEVGFDEAAIAQGGTISMTSLRLTHGEG